MIHFIPETRLCVCLFTLSLFATIGEPFENRESSNSYSLAVKHLNFHRFPFFSLWKLPLNRLNKRLTIFVIIKLFKGFSSPSPATLSPFRPLLRSRRFLCLQNPHFSCFSCQIKPSKSFLITFRAISPIQNFKSSPKFKNPKSKP